jgi:hypothetical protein
MEVDRAPTLVLGHLGIGDPDQPTQPGLVQADQAAQGTLDGDGGPPPQLRGQGVPEHLRLGVVAGRTQWLPQPRVIHVMAMPAASPLAVRAAGTLAVRMAGQDQPPLGLARVDPAEAGAVKVTNSRGWEATVSGTPLPPFRPVCLYRTTCHEARCERWPSTAMSRSATATRSPPACPTPSRKRPTNQPGTRADRWPTALIHGRLRLLCRLPWWPGGMPRRPPSPRVQGQGNPSGQATGGQHHDRGPRQLRRQPH